MDIRDLINNEDGRPSYPKDTMLVAKNGSGTDSTVSDEQIQEILSRLTTLEAKKDKYTSFVTEYKLMGTVDSDGKEAPASSQYVNYGVALGSTFTDKTGEHPDAIVKLTYYSPKFSFDGVTITDGDSSKSYDITIPALPFDIPLYELKGEVSSSQLILPIRAHNGDLISDHREIRAIVTATARYEIIGEDLVGGDYLDDTTPEHRALTIDGMNLLVDIFNQTSDDKVHRASIVIEYEFDKGSGNGTLSTPTTNTTPTRYNCSIGGTGATFSSELEEGANATNCVRIIRTKLNEI